LPERQGDNPADRGEHAMGQTFSAVDRTELPGLLKRGKVRDIYDLGEQLMIVATDRISAFDVVLDVVIPGKGVVLTELTRFWLETLAACQPHHLEYVVRAERVPPGYEAYAVQLAGRAMVVKKAAVLPVECVVRGYLFGSGWQEYEATGKVSGVRLPAGLRLAERLEEPIFTPSTKAHTGHDEPITFEQACQIARRFMLELGAAPGAGRAVMEEVRRRSIEIYREARDYAAARGIVIADTKFEFGLWNNRLLLVDEVLTPDSSRFWPADQYEPGGAPPSFDKQFIRNYLAGLNWDRKPPAPSIPEQVVRATQERYFQAYRLLTGRSVELART
jgi:phosphoribosylaminoimidazole-succinocarboxamide synthase